MTTMTKAEMVSEIMNSIKTWGPCSIKNNSERALRCTKGVIEEVYNMYISDKEHAIFYATILAR